MRRCSGGDVRWIIPFNQSIHFFNRNEILCVCVHCLCVFCGSFVCLFFLLSFWMSHFLCRPFLCVCVCVLATAVGQFNESIERNNWFMTPDCSVYDVWIYRTFHTVHYTQFIFRRFARRRPNEWLENVKTHKRRGKIIWNEGNNSNNTGACLPSFLKDGSKNEKKIVRWKGKLLA